MLWVLLAVAWLIVWVIMFVEVLRRPDLDTKHKAGWALVILLLPVVGLAAYLVVRPKLTHEEHVHMGDPAPAEDLLESRHPF
jgi:hypothetical protein